MRVAADEIRFSLSPHAGRGNVKVPLDERGCRHCEPHSGEAIQRMTDRAALLDCFVGFASSQ